MLGITHLKEEMGCFGGFRSLKHPIFPSNSVTLIIQL